MLSINTFAVGMRVAGVARALPASTWTAHVPTSAHATASAAATAHRKRRNATGSVERGTI